MSFLDAVVYIFVKRIYHRFALGPETLRLALTEVMEGGTARV